MRPDEPPTVCPPHPWREGPGDPAAAKLSGTGGRHMSKLTTLTPGLRTLTSRLAPPQHATVAERFRYREQHAPWRAWYRTAAWSRLRMHVFERDLFTCQWPGCGRLQGDTSQLVAHHLRPHRGNAKMFWDLNNLHTVCKACHDGPIQAQERATLGI